MPKLSIKLLLVLIFGANLALAQDTVRYTGATLANVDYHNGQLPLAMGVHNIQVMRANRSDTTAAGGFGWTYNHAPMLAYWNHRFYLEYLSNPVGEHVPPGQTLLITSDDGYKWSAPVVIFPPYKIPDGTSKKGQVAVASNLYAVMHQRMGFYTASNKKLLALGFYGMVIGAKDDPNDGNGIGRVVREIKTDGTFGPVYFIRYNHAFGERNTIYPLYKSSADKAFVAACDELLSKPLMMQQWNEEADRDDPLIPLKKDFKAFNFYHLPDGRTVGLWKYALSSVSKDDGKTWLYNPLRSPGFVNANAKIWGQKTSDGRFATVYNPSEFRWPLALSVSDDGLNYNNLLLVNGEIASMRYGGNYKSYGPQYVRGIQEGDGLPPDGKLWVTYSMNKEDIWLSNIPVPVTTKETTNVDDDFTKLEQLQSLSRWNIYSPLWAGVSVEKNKNGAGVIAIHDADPFDYATLERLLPAAKRMNLEFTITPGQDNYGLLDIELRDAKGTPCIRLSFDSSGTLSEKAGYRSKNIAPYKAGETYKIKVELDTDKRFYTVTVNGGKPISNIFFAPVDRVERVFFRTGHVRRFPDADTPTDQVYDLPNAGAKEKEAVYYLGSFKSTRL